MTRKRKEKTVTLPIPQGSAVVQISCPTFGLRFLGGSDPCVFRNLADAKENTDYLARTHQADQWEVFEHVGSEWVFRSAGSTHDDPLTWHERPASPRFPMPPFPQTITRIQQS